MHVYVMIKKLIPFFFIFVTYISPIFSENVRFTHHPETSILMQINKDPRYSAKVQLQERFNYGFSLILFQYFGIDMYFHLYNVLPSGLADGSQYRGFTAFGPGAGLFGRYPFPDNKIAVRAFARFQPNFASYYSINTLFFFFSLESGAGIEIWLSKKNDWFIFAAIPVSISFRRDLA